MRKKNKTNIGLTNALIILHYNVNIFLMIMGTLELIYIYREVEMKTC